VKNFCDGSYEVDEYAVRNFHTIAHFKFVALGNFLLFIF